MPYARFVRGKIWRHIVLMSTTNAVGLTALFLVDMADLFFISLLGQAELAAAVGYAGTITFFTTSVSIGLSIAMTALVSRAIGQRQREQANALVVSVLLSALVISVLVAAMVWLSCEYLLSFIGAQDETHRLATQYLRIILPSMPILSLAMCAGAALRSVADAKRAMWSTLIGGAVNALLDPLFIFVFDWGLAGAALATVCARVALALVAFHGVIVRHKLYQAIDLARWRHDLSSIIQVALPAIATNVATPIGNAYVTASIAKYGDGFVAGWAVVGRMSPLVFALIFSLSGAIGPIIGQNFGAHRFDRLKQAVYQSLAFVSGYVLIASLLLMMAQDHVVALFNLSGDAASLTRFFCQVIAISFMFNGSLFVANACFNNLGYPTISTVLNFGKATLGTMPFVALGAKWGGVNGILLGQALGAVIFGLIGIVCCVFVIRRIQQRHLLQSQEPVLESAVPLSPFSSSRSYMCTQPSDLCEQDESKP